VLNGFGKTEEMSDTQQKNRRGVSAGLRTFWIQRSAAEAPEELGVKVDATVKAITDLPALLRG
jgi:hypothetical protein